MPPDLIINLIKIQFLLSSTCHFYPFNKLRVSYLSKSIIATINDLWNNKHRKRKPKLALENKKQLQSKSNVNNPVLWDIKKSGEIMSCPELDAHRRVSFLMKIKEESEEVREEKKIESK